MKRYVFNSTVLTTFGTFTYTELSEEEAKIWIELGDYICALGHQEMVAQFNTMFNQRTKRQRVNALLDIGDEALVFRFKYRIPKHKKSKAQTLYREFIELGLLRRIS